MRASWGLNAPAQRERRSVVLLLFLFRDSEAAGDDGMNDSSRRDVMYCVRLEEISLRVW